MKFSRIVTLLCTISLLCACSVFQTTPKPPPAAIAGQAQEVTRAQTYGLEKIANVSARVYGSPMDIQAEIARQANARGASYYLIVMYTESKLTPGQWYSQAILYR
ncbi:biofilm peroxide resistance protein BsmA [Gibbsiella quercinecans]|uniref:biofilm peroxide resistance protein BsmA n=1 Tax=Gibbsiella quercinecans TaxID=929813 RepID=UPI003A4D3D39